MDLPGAPAATTPTSPVPTRNARGVRVFAGVLVAAVLLLGVIVVLVGARPASWGELTAAVRAGDVVAVTVEGDDVGPEAVGHMAAVVLWTQGPWRHHTDVLVRLGDPEQGTGPTDTRLEIVEGSVQEALRALRPDLEITSKPAARTVGLLAGWRVPIGLVAWPLVVAAATLGLLIAGPEPRFATRWAWFWLLISPLAAVVALAFLTQAAVTAHRPTERRLTGGWAFLISLVAMGRPG
ncbi:hypothetical protein G7070_07285 [Propioniciclava coleopterorum]|uniref:Uncharacterized protein n=1 Tax=Propioniciclava coleopterorum TaxID=2714937 RepID=A0A6G7Y636_9ACTN|nr:hypothetical protein [Propioniciclava coleopterorum]QIK72108.1 hypothetical protein G7070_07285 [Propioniciclava coleopterorum]